MVRGLQLQHSVTLAFHRTRRFYSKKLKNFLVRRQNPLHKSHPQWEKKTSTLYPCLPLSKILISPRTVGILQ